MQLIRKPHDRKMSFTNSKGIGREWKMWQRRGRSGRRDRAPRNVCLENAPWHLKVKRQDLNLPETPPGGAQGEDGHPSVARCSNLC